MPVTDPGIDRRGGGGRHFLLEIIPTTVRFLHVYALAL